MFEIALERQTTSPVSTVTAHGILDGRNAEHLAVILGMASDSERLIIDLAGVWLADGAGIAALAGGIGTAQAEGLEVELVARPDLSKGLAEQGVRFGEGRPLPAGGAN